MQQLMAKPGREMSPPLDFRREMIAMASNDGVRTRTGAEKPEPENELKSSVFGHCKHRCVQVSSGKRIFFSPQTT